MRFDYLSIGLLLIVVAAIGYAVFNRDGLLVAREQLTDAVADMARKVPGEDEPLPNLGKAANIAGIVGWINTEPLTNADLRGKVVLVDFWTYSCINCIRTFPYVQSWHEKYADDGFILLGVHTPEFNFEHIRENVVQAAAEHGLTYPIAQDNDYVTWRAFNNRYWPAHYLIDVDGNIRYRHFGEGEYAETEAAIQSLLREGGLLDADVGVVVDEEEESDLSGVQTPETYLGFQRIDHYSGPQAPTNTPFDFPTSKNVPTNTFSLSGRWTVGPESATLSGEQGSIFYRYFANQANLVMAPPEGVVAVAEVLLDGMPIPRGMAGTDVAYEGDSPRVTIDSSRLYNLTENTGGGWHTLELRVLTPGLQAFAFTFG